MDPKERLDDLLLYFQLKDDAFKKMYGFDRDELYEMYRKIHLMNDDEIRILSRRLLINEDYIFGKSQSIIPTKQVFNYVRKYHNDVEHKYKLNRLANERIRKFVLKVVQTKDDLKRFKGVTKYRMKAYLDNQINLDNREIEIIAKKLHLNLDHLYQDSKQEADC